MAPLLALLLGSGPAVASPDWDEVGVQAAREAEGLAAALGPRPAGSAAERRLAAWVAAEVDAAGWTVRPAPGCPDCVLACRGAGRRLVLAHLDSVPGSPGAVDNLAGVAALVALARHGDATDLCLGFPSGEERGLLGSRAMAAAWPEPLPELVVALDLTGHGRLSVTGLGPRWGGAQLGWLLDHAEVDSPYPYRVVSRILPGMERSDHAPFADRGALALHLLGRGPHGVFEHYHQPEDTAVEPQAMADLLRALDALATAPPPPASPPDAAVPVGGGVLPAWGTWLLVGLGLASAALDLVRPHRGRPVLGALRGLWSTTWRGLLATAAAALAMALPTRAGVLSVAPGEATAAAVMGIPPSGWWSGADSALLLGGVAFLGVRRLLGGAGSAPLAAGVLALLALRIDVLLALPLALGALLGRVHPVLAALPALVLLWPDRMRELAFHGLLPPAFWGLLWLLAVPALGAARRRSPSPGDTAPARLVEDR